MSLVVESYLYYLVKDGYREQVCERIRRDLEKLTGRRPDF